MTYHDLHSIRDLWVSGFNTAEIAQAMKLKEHEVENYIHDWLRAKKRRAA